MAPNTNDVGTIIYSFGPFKFIPERQLILREGLPLKIGGRAFDILTLLVKRSGEVVSKNELLDFCWPNTYVQDSNLKVNVAALRRALGGDNSESYIATIPNRGYRFVARIEEELFDPPAKKMGAFPSVQIRPPPNLIGRDDEITRLEKKLNNSRCLTIVGSGGIGKTSVALALAHDVLAKYPQGVYFIDLSTVGDPQYTLSAVASAVGARQRSGDMLGEVVAALAGRKILLALDNCEHVQSTVSSISTHLLDSLPMLTILATSREPLSNEHERLYRLPGLSVPPGDEELTAKQALGFSAVDLFVARAGGRGIYSLSDADAPLVAAICRRLDGIPLAIELVASKTFAYGIHTLLTMVNQKFLVLGNGERTAPFRQQTMLATLDWSYRLLSESEAALLRVLSAFSGSFMLEDATAIAEPSGFDQPQVTDGIERLASKSLIHLDYQNGSLAYRLLESTRAFAGERLREAGERQAAMLGLATRILALFEKAASEAETRDKSEWMEEYAPRIHDARTALAWAFDHEGDTMLGVRLTAAIAPLFYELSALNEMQSRVEHALQVANSLEGFPKEIRMKLVAARATGLFFAQHLTVDIEAVWRECYELGRETGRVKYQVMGLWGLTSYLGFVGRSLEANTELDKLVALAEEQQDFVALDEALRLIAIREMYRGEIASARERLERLAAPHKDVDDPTFFARFQSERGVAVRCAFAFALFMSGEPRRAIHVVGAAVERAKMSRHGVSHLNSLLLFAAPIAFWSGDYFTVEDLLHQAEGSGSLGEIRSWRELYYFYGDAVRAKRQQPGAADDFKDRLSEVMKAGQLVRAPMYQAMVAEALCEADALADADATATEALNLTLSLGLFGWEPEILRVRAMVQLKLGNGAEGEELLVQAITKASKIGALTFELRATIVLASRLRDEGRLMAAHNILLGICSKFSESEVSPVIIDARRMLHALRPRASHPEGSGRIRSHRNLPHLT